MFDFDATLPVMALQFILLAVVLNAVFYKPLSKVLDERAEYIRQTESGAKEQLAKTEALVTEYELQLSSARKQSQEIISGAQAEAQKLASERIAVAQQEAIARKEAIAAEIAQEKEEAFRSLEGQVASLSRQILEKLLGPELVR
jgi:F-type H+-transporting ATPase subunit b